MKKQNKTLATVPGQQTTCRPSGRLRRTRERSFYYVILCATSASFGSSRQLICFCASAPPIRTSDASHASQPKLFQNVAETAEFECSATTEAYFTTNGQFDKQRSLISVLFHGTGSSGSERKMNLPGPRVRLSVYFCQILIIRTPSVSLQRATDGKVSNDESRKVYVFKLSAFDNILILTTESHQMTVRKRAIRKTMTTNGQITAMPLCANII